MRLNALLLAIVVGAGCGPSGDDEPECESATQCPGEQICDPSDGRCSALVDCDEHADCGTAAHCTEESLCAQSDIGSPCGDDINCLPRDTCTGGYCGCEGESYSAHNAPPNVLIVLDRSGSMNQAEPGGTKWTIALQAINALLTNYGEQIRFGLALFPGTNQDCSEGDLCTAGMVAVDPAEPPESTVGPINDFLAGTSTCSYGTPTAEMLTSLIDYSGLESADRSNYILLLTDGESTCEDPVPVVATLRAESPEVKTFAIGFGSGVDARELNDIAKEGGTDFGEAPPYYYAADDFDSLNAALGEIAGTVFYCNYTLSEVPDDVNELYVYLDGDLVVRDPNHVNGWDYDPDTNQLTFYGNACRALQEGEVTDLVIVYGCPIFVP